MIGLKRFVSVVLAAIIMVSMIATVSFATGEDAGMDNFIKRSIYTAGQFTDVKTADWFSDNVQTVSELGLMNGKGNGLFDPNGNVTIAELITITARLHSIYHTGSDSFPASDPWYMTYYNYADQQGILPPADGDLNVPAVRWQVSLILQKALPKEELAEINQVADDTIPDVRDDAYGAEAVYQFYRAGIMTGSDAYGTFQPNANVKRSEVAAVVSRLVDETQRKTITLKKQARAIASGDCSSFDVNKPGQPRMFDRGRFESDCTWTLTEDGTMTISGNGPMALYYAVEGGTNNITLDSRPWRDHVKDIKKVIVTDGVTTITNESFMFCSNLTEIELPDTVTSIGDSFVFGCTSLEKLKMPSYLTKFGGYGFDVGLESLEIPEGVETLSLWICMNSKNVKSVTFPSTLKEIKGHAFSDCSFSTVKIPESVTHIYKNAITQSVSTPIEKVYFYGDLPEWRTNAIGNWRNTGTNFPDADQPTLYFIEGKAGWTTPTWTAPDGTVYQTRTFDPEVIPYSD